MVDSSNGISIYPRDIFKVLLKRIWIIALSGIILGGIFYSVSLEIVDPVYQSTITLYVSNTTSEGGETMITANDLAVAKSLVNFYTDTVTSDRVLEKVIDIESLNMSAEELKSKIQITSSSDTSLFKITVKDGSPELAAEYANAIGECTAQRVSEIVLGSSARIVDSAKSATNPDTSYLRTYMQLGAILGVLLASMIVLIVEFLRKTVDSEIDLEEFAIPVLGNIPRSKA